MKRVKTDASNFKKLSSLDMKKIDGGTWINVPQSDGTVKHVWV